MSKSMCRHCGRREVSRPRGLCWVDYYAPGVRDLYPPFDERLSSARPHAEKYRKPVKPATDPTRALPGTPEKIAVMCERVERGEAVTHPRDARVPD